VVIDSPQIYITFSYPLKSNRFNEALVVSSNLLSVEINVANFYIN
jgi:hexokinase